MTKLSLFLLLSFIFGNRAIGQTLLADSVYTTKGILLVNIKEVTNEHVKFTYPKEDVLNLLPISSILRIRFKSGRVQTFITQDQKNEKAANSTPFKVTSELIRSIVTQDCDTIIDAASCTVSSNCKFVVLDYFAKGNHIYSVELKSIGYFTDIKLSLDYEIFRNTNGEVMFTLQSVYCY